MNFMVPNRSKTGSLLPSAWTDMTKCVAVCAAILALCGGCDGNVNVVDNPGSGSNGSGGPPPAPTVSVNPSSLTFSAQPVGTSAVAQVITVSNTGNANLSVTGVSVGGTDAAMFAQTNTCGSGVAAGQSCTLSVTFTPTSTGGKSASVDVLTNAATSPVIALSGTGGPPPPAPIVSVDPSNLVFGAQPVGTSAAAQVITVSNTGNATLSITGISIGGTDAAMFAQTNTCGSGVAVGQLCTVSVTFAPTSTGAKSASLDLLTNAATSPVIALSGTGAPPLPPIGFTDVTDQAGVAHASETYGASWGDVNGDGLPDLWVSNHRTAKSLFKNKGDGTFVDIAPTINNLANRPNADTHGGSWADFNNDGTQDLLVSLGVGNPSEWFVNKSGKLTFETLGSGFDVTDIGGRMPVWLDFDNDHRLDVILAQYAGWGRLFHQNSDGTFTEMYSTAKFRCFRFYYAQLIDVNDDGRLDVMCSGEADFPQKIYDTSKMPWKTLFDSAAPAAFMPVVHSVADSAIADFDNDGHMDMFILSGVQNRPSSVVQEGNKIEALLSGGSKGFNFVSQGNGDLHD